MCLEGKVRLRCHDCREKFLCPTCDDKVHSFLPFHYRDGFVNGFFHPIPPTITVSESGEKQDIGKRAYPHILEITVGGEYLLSYCWLSYGLTSHIIQATGHINK